MKPNKKELLEIYDISEHYGIECFLDHSELDKLLTGEGAKVAKEKYPEYITIESKIDNEDKYKIWTVATKINKNPEVSFFTCVADKSLTTLKIEFWGSDALLAEARLVGENGDILLKFLTEEQK